MPPITARAPAGAGLIRDLSVPVSDPRDPYRVQTGWRDPDTGREYPIGGWVPDRPGLEPVWGYEPGVAAGLEALEMQREQLDVLEPFYQAQAELARGEEARAEAMWQHYEELYWPVEQRWVREAEIPVAQEAARAAAGVRQQFTLERETAEREMRGLGLDPSDPRYQQIRRDYGVAEAAAVAGAQTEAARRVRDINRARMSEIVALGKGLPSEAATMAATAGGLFGAAGQTVGQAYGGLTQAAGLLAQAGTAAGRGLREERMGERQIEAQRAMQPEWWEALIPSVGIQFSPLRD